MFKEFLEKCLRYENLYILEETGNREKIKRISKRHGKVTEIYFNSQGYFIIRDQKRLRLVKFN